MTGSTTTPLELPDLLPYRPFFISVGPSDYPETEGPKALRFSVMTGNSGQYPLDLLGESQSATAAKASQCLRWKVVDVSCDERREVGQFSFHPAHGHFHFEDFALYELRKLTDSGAPDMTSKGLVATSGKVTFCLQDTQPDNSIDDVVSDPPFYFLCTYLRQGVSSGWADQYSFDYEGQQIPLAGIPDGDYGLVITTNPDHVLFETSFANNVSYARVRIYDNGTRVRDI